MDEELDLKFLNLEFRLMLLDERLKELTELADKLVQDVKAASERYGVTNDK